MYSCKKTMTTHWPSSIHAFLRLIGCFQANASCDVKRVLCFCIDSNHDRTDQFYKNPNIPKQKAFDNYFLLSQVLRFYGYYVERLAGGDPQFPEYGYRVRKVVVFYHMEDDTVSVFEPHLENSGLEQGVTCPRGRYYWPRNGVKTDMQPFRINDFKIGKDYPIRHYLIHLYDADDFTKVGEILWRWIISL